MKNYRKSNFFLILNTLILLSACGIRGELKTPPPLWNNTSFELEHLTNGNEIFQATVKNKIIIQKNI